MSESIDDAAIFVKSLTYSYLNSEPVLKDIDLCLSKGSRTLLIGANGAGKSTLLQILAGKKMTRNSQVLMLGKDVFRNIPEGVTYLGTEWAMNPVVRSDVVVSVFLDSVGGYRHKARRDSLLNILDVDLDWHMHAISDGERRRVQLVMGLMSEWDVLLLDEITVDLDVLVRDDLLKFLKDESETRGATVLYATHIFDGLDFFPTNIIHMQSGCLVSPPALWPLDSMSNTADTHTSSYLHKVALQWLKEDRKTRKQEEEGGKRPVTRGPRRSESVPSDSEIFYRKYDYTH